MTKNYLEAFVMLIVAFAVGFFLVLPKYQEKQAVERQIQEKNEIIKNNRDYYAGLAVIVDNLDKYQGNLEKVNVALPDRPDAPALMNFVQAAAMQSGLLVKGIDYAGNTKPLSEVDYAVDELQAAAVQGLTLQSYLVSMSLAGSYGNFKNFLSMIERSGRLIAIESIDLQSKNNKEESNDVDAGQVLKGVDKIINYNVKLSVNYYRQI
jgi:Tfp pilus assembly protein PilO